jgi:hypothetical protein
MKYFITILFMLMEMLQKPTQRSYYSKDHLLFTPFSKMSWLEKLVFSILFHVTENSVLNEYQGPNKLFKLYAIFNNGGGGIQSL